MQIERNVAVVPDVIPAERPADTFPTPGNLTSSASGYLDLFRACAALLVFISHWRAFYFVDYGEIQGKYASLPIKALYYLCGLGRRQAVMVFFVLSGFFICSSIFRKLSQRKWRWMDYILDRGTRLYVVLIPGLLLGLLWDWIGIHFFNQTGIYSARLVPFGHHIAANNLTISSFFANLFFLQTRFTDIFGSNDPLWSLFNEFWYYVLFPSVLLSILWGRKRAYGKMILPFLFAGVSAWILGSQLLGFIVWLSGGLLPIAPRIVPSKDSARWKLFLYTGVSAVLFVACFLAARVRAASTVADLSVGFSFSLLVYLLLSFNFSMSPWLQKLSKSLASFSYSLYILHFPLFYLFRAGLIPTGRWQPDTRHMLYGTLIAITVFLYAFLIAHLSERNTATVRHWIRTIFTNRSPIAVSTEATEAAAETRQVDTIGA